MANIGFLFDHFPGHIIPSFKLAHELSKQGHKVTYLVIPDAASLIREHGFEVRTILEEYYPEGYANIVGKSNTLHFEGLLDGCLDQVMDELSLDTMVSGYFVSLDSLIISRKYALPQVLLTTHIRPLEHNPAYFAQSIFVKLQTLTAEKIYRFLSTHDLQANSVEELLRPVNDFTEIIAAPEELVLPEESFPENVKFINTGINYRQQGELELLKELRQAGKTIIFASMGSRALMDESKSRFFFHKMLHMMRNNAPADWHMILAHSELDITQLGRVPDNVTATDWIDQTQVLQYASVAIFHGGIGTIKECIASQVPMLVYSRSMETTLNIKRLENSHLGRGLYLLSLDSKALADTCQSLIHDPQVARALKDLNGNYRQQEKEMRGAAIILKTLEAIPV